jgi:hypothetical protein
MIDKTVMVSAPGLKEIVIQIVKNLRILELIENSHLDYVNHEVVYNTEDLEFVSGRNIRQTDLRLKLYTQRICCN